MNPLALKIPGYSQDIPENQTGLQKFTGKAPADIVNSLVQYLFVIAGLILLFLLIFGGFELMTSAGDPEKIKKAQAKITSAIVGFLIIFLSYWIAQALGIMLGFNLLAG